MPNRPPLSSAILENPAVIIQRLSTVEVNLSSLNTHLDGMAQRMDAQAKAQSDKIDQMFTSFDKRFSEQIASTNAQLAERGKTPWGLLISAMGIMIVIIQGLSSLQFGPVRADIDRLNVAITNLASNTTSSGAFAEFKSTYENNRITSRQDNDNRFAAIETKFQNQVPRGEHERVWASYDQRFTDVQRQVDEVKAAQGSVYGARDVILDLRERLDRIERQKLGQP
ncbi:hypothetical protein [Neorhizobium lilium]|uniref:hypothetical protein n=1 Tax=Neorhizobium lilium TaxID=2503024 RepID=UPI00197DDF3D|nr:hypothetical protein [Neorhizobium lilium]